MLEENKRETILIENDTLFIGMIKVALFHKTKIIITTLVTLLLGIILAYTSTPIYRSVVLVQYVSSEETGGLAKSLSPGLGTLARAAGVGLGGGGNRDAALATLKSHSFMQSFLEKEQLMPILFSSQWDEEASKWVPDDDGKIPTVWNGVKRLQKGIIRITDDPSTGMTTIAVDWENRQYASDWANNLVSRVNDHLREIAISEAKQNIAYLEAELAKSRLNEVSVAISNILENQIEKIMLANVREQFAFKVIDRGVPSPEDLFVKPNRGLIIIASLLGGLLFGFGLAVLTNMVNAYRASND